MQSRKFDPAGRFIRRYVPEIAALNDDEIHAPWEAKPMERLAAGVALGTTYPSPVVAHEEARARTLERFGVLKTSPRARP